MKIDAPEKWLLFIALGASMLAGADASAAPVPPPHLAEPQLRAINHRFVNAFAVGDGVFMTDLVDRDFLRLNAQGQWMDREQHLDSVYESRFVGRVSYDAVDVRLFGEVAVVAAVFEAIAADGSPRRARYTDVYRWDGMAWKLVNGQNTRMDADVGKDVIRGVPRTPSRWRGSDPSGDDERVLRDLNAGYFRALREADAGWHDAHLAPGYVGVNPDGSAHDRAAVLAGSFVSPVAKAGGPVRTEEVRVRRFGSIALVHSGNVAETDGRQGADRYTGIWHKQPDGRWLCISLHVTPRKDPQR